jgi:ribulose-5-phosphate 4-epimerase/fuculose-1-phosphate aldolase
VVRKEEELRLAGYVQPYRKGIARVAQAVFSLGWAEANAGNFSYRILGGLLTKTAGAKMGEIAKDPLPYICVVFPVNGFRYKVLPENRKPTSEILAHLAGQRTLMRHRPEERVLLHTHPTELVRLSTQYSSPKGLLEQIFSQRKGRDWRTIVSAVKAAPPGSVLLARRTGLALKKSRLVIWPGHGVIASGRTLFQALRLIKAVNEIVAGKNDK